MLVWTVITLAALASGSARAVEPPVPFDTEFHYWNNHWYVWLPGHAVYEAVEVMSTAALETAKPLVWVFFTERALPKRQHHYVNNAAVAAATGWTYAAIDYATIGGAEGPLGLSVRFSEADGKAVVIAVDFASNMSLSSAGLTDQMGHSADRHFLLFYRELTARTEQSHVTLDGIEVSEPRGKEPVPFRAAYSRNVYVGTIRFATTRYAFAAAGCDLDFRVQQSGDATHHRYVAARASGGRVELLTDANGQLERYFNRGGSHTLTVAFSPALGTSEESTYGIGFDKFHDLVTGKVRVTHQDDGLVLDWRSQEPAWARAYPMRTQMQHHSSGCTVLSVSKAVP